MGLFILFLQATRSDSPSQQARDLAQLTGRALEILVYSLDLNITFFFSIELFHFFTEIRHCVTILS